MSCGRRSLVWCWSIDHPEQNYFCLWQLLVVQGVKAQKEKSGMMLEHCPPWAKNYLVSVESHATLPSHWINDHLPELCSIERLKFQKYRWWRPRSNLSMSLKQHTNIIKKTIYKYNIQIQKTNLKDKYKYNAGQSSRRQPVHESQAKMWSQSSLPQHCGIVQVPAWRNCQE